MQIEESKIRHQIHCSAWS